MFFRFHEELRLEIKLYVDEAYPVFQNEPDSVPLTFDGYGSVVSLSGFIHG